MRLAELEHDNVYRLIRDSQHGGARYGKAGQLVRVNLQHRAAAFGQNNDDQVRGFIVMPDEVHGEFQTDVELWFHPGDLRKP